MASIRIAVVWTALISSVARAEPPPFEIQNARGTGGLALTAPASANPWTRTIRVATSEAEASTKGLRIIEPIVVETDAGDAVRLSVSRQPADQPITPDTPLAVALTGTFARAGLYHGEIVLVQPPKQRVVPVQITVAAPTTSALQDHGGRSIAVTESITGAADTTLAIRLENTGDDPVQVVPVVAGVARVDKLDNPTYQLAVGAAAAPSREPIKPTPIAPHAIESFAIPVRGVDEPGIYAVELQLRDDAGARPPFPLRATVYRRQSGWWAALAIALGALVAWGVRGWVSDGKDRLALRRRLAFLVEQIRALRATAHNEDVITAARVFELDIDDRQRDARSGGKLDELKDIATRAEARLALLREIAAAFVELARIDPDKQAPARKVLDTALIVVRIDPGKPDAGSPEAIKTQRDEVAKLALAGARRDQLNGAVVELTTQIDAQRKVASAALATALAAVRTRLDRATALAGDGKLDELQQLVDGARRDVVDACLDELARIAGGPAPFGARTWSEVAAKLTAQIAEARREPVWDRRNRALRDSQSLYIATRIHGLADAARTLADGGDPRAAQLRQIADDLTAALARGPDEAAARYADALAVVAAAPPAPAPPATAKGASGGVSLGPISFGGDDEAPTSAAGWLPLHIASIAETIAPALADPAKLDRAIASYGFLVSLAVLAIAVASGVRTLWMDNLSWGGASALLNAILWGAGVQATGDAFTSLVGLRAKLGAPPTT
jgi:hypothetical protein